MSIMLQEYIWMNMCVCRLCGRKKCNFTYCIMLGVTLVMQDEQAKEGLNRLQCVADSAVGAVTELILQLCLHKKNNSSNYIMYWM